MTTDPAPTPADRGHSIRPPRPRIGVIVSFAVSIALLAVIAIVAEAEYTRRTRESTTSLLASVARGQALAVSSFMRERTADATVIAEDPRTRLVLDPAVSPARRREGGDSLRAWLQVMARTYGYHNLGVVDREGRPLVFSDHDELPSAGVREAVAAAVAARAPQVLPLQREARDELIFGVAVPAFASRDGGAAVVGAVYGVLLGEERLLAGLGMSMIEGGSSDATLLQRLRDTTWVFGSRLSGAASPGAGVPVPTDDTAYVAVQAFGLGTEGALVGRDFRGVTVRSYVVPVPGTPWVVLSKIDLSEAESRIRATRAAGTLIFLLLVSTVVFLGRSLLLERQREYEAMHARLGGRALRVVQGALDGYAAFDERGRFLEVNDALLRMTGHTEEELLGMSLHDVTATTTAGDTQATLDAVRAADGVQYVSHWRRKDGSVIDLAVSARHMREETGSRFVAFLRDITGPQRLQRRLERANRLYLFLNHVSEGLFASRTREEAFETLCRIAAAEEVFGLAAISVVDRAAGVLRITHAAGADVARVLGITAPLDPPPEQLISPAAQCVRDRQPVVVPDYLASPATARYHDLAREYGIRSAICLPVLESGEVVATIMLYVTEPDFLADDEVAVLSEISRFLGLLLQSHAAAETRRLEEERFRALFEFSPMAMYVVDEASGAMLRVNRAFTTLLGYTRDDLPSLDAALERFYPDPAYREHLTEVFAHDVASLSAERSHVVSPTLAVRCRDGREVFLQGFLTRVGTELLVGWIDLTELRVSQHLATEAQAIAKLTSWEFDFASDEVHYADRAHEADVDGTPGRRGLFDRMLPEDRERARRAFLDAVQRRVPIDTVARYRMEDGAVRYLRNRMRVEYDTEGRPLRAIGTSQDVTEETLLAQELDAHRLNLEKLVDARTAELARANAQLLVTDKRLKAMLELSQRAAALDEAELLQLAVDEAVRLTGSAHGYLHLITDDQQRIEINAWSSGTAELCGIPAESHYPVDTAGIWAEAVRTRRPSMQNDFARAAHREGYPPGHVPLQRHLVVPHVDGDRVRMVLGVGNKAADYDASDAQELELIARDIWGLVQRKRTESALKWAYEQVAASDERFAFAMEASAEGIWDWNLRSDTVSYSSEYLSILGYAPGEFSTRGTDWGAHLHPEDRDGVLRTFRDDLTRDQPSQIEFRIRRKDGTYIWAMITGKVVERAADGAALRVVGTFTDLTARRAADQELRAAKEAADEANRAKSAFLAVMSHEIRTPLNGVIGMAEVLAQSPLPVREADAVRTIRDSASNLLTLIDDILDFSKIEAGRLELEYLDTDVHELLDGIVSSLGPIAMARHVDLSVFIAPDVPRRIRTDATRLRQIIYNLLGNAIKFSSGRLERLGRVAVRVELEQAAPLLLRFSVRDNGIGISDAAQERLFATFVQAEASTTRRYGGTGLGLAICKRLTDLLGGRITVRSKVGLGSTFTVVLPTEASVRQPVVALPDIAGVQCVLVRHDDDFSQVEDLAAYLRHAGAQVTVASSADAGRRVAEELPRPVVLVEWTQPGDERPGAAPLDDGIHHLRITHGQRRTPRVIAPNLLALDQLAIREPSLVRAVAIAAGRASPDVVLDDGERPLLDPHARAVSVSEARRQGSLILVAEDDEINQKVILRQLDLLGHAAEVASDGAEALAMWRRGTYAMLITDLHMPEMDGYALAAAIRREESPTQRLPIVALTANALRGEEVRAKAAGVDEYLTKPIRLKDLKRTLTHWLQLDDAASVPSVSDGGTSGATPDGAAPPRRSTPRPAFPPDGVSTPTGNEAVAGNGLIETVLDPDVLKRYVGDEPELVQEFLVSFREAAHQYHGRLTRAMARGDFATVANTAHTFKSSARAVGALALGDLCAEVESAAKRHDVDGLERHLGVFAGELAKVDARLDQLLIPKP